MKDKLLIIGAGGHGRVVADTAQVSGQWSEFAFVDSRYPQLTQSGQWPVVGNDEMLLSLQEDYSSVVVAVGDNKGRLRLHEIAQQAGFQLVVVVHPSAVVGSDVKLGEGTVVFAGAVINYGATLGRSCVINTAATIDHDCSLDDGVHLSPGVHLAGGVTIGECSWVGMGASVIQQITIDKDAVVGAGAAVINNIEQGATVVGVPAKNIIQ